MIDHIHVQFAINLAIALAYSSGEGSRGSRHTGRRTPWMVVVSEREAISGAVYPHGKIEVDGETLLDRLDVQT